MKKRLRVLVFSTLSLSFWFFYFGQLRVIAEEPTKNIGATPYIYEVPLNLIDTFTNLWSANKKETEKLFVTQDGLIIENYQSTENPDKSVNVRFNVYNDSVSDGLVEIYDKRGQLVRFEKLIAGNPAPENLVDGFTDLFGSVGGDLIQGRQILNVQDIRNNTEKTEFEITLNPGERADITRSSGSALYYNLAKSVIGFADLVSGIDQKQYESFLIEFVKDAQFKGLSKLYLDSLLSQVLSSPNTTLEKLRSSEAFTQLLLDVKNYVVEKGGETLSDTLKDKLSDAIIESIKLANPAVSVTAKLTFSASKVSNIFARTVSSSKLYSQKIQPLTIALSSDLNQKTVSSPIQQSRPNRFSQNEFLHNQLTGITQGASSHIGSAAYFLGRSPVNDSIYDQQFSGATNSNVGENAQFPFYTSDQPLKAPIDIVLSWDQARTRLDLDSHLTGPATDNPNSPVRFQTYWRQRGDLNTFPFALLYRDSIPDPNINPNGLIGVEQTRIGITQPGVYRFYVHNYSEFVNTPAGQVNGTSGLSNSGAQVQIFEAGTGIPTFDPNNPNAQSVGSAVSGAIPVPPNQQGNVWYVFQLDARTGILRRVNTFNPNIVPENQVPAFGEPSR